MVSFWPFGRGNANSTDDFERILARLASQISSQSTKLAGLRQCSRRYKALWTLYTVFAYTVCVIILFFVVGTNELGPQEYGGIFGGPVLIWAVRKLLDFHYERQIISIEVSLQELQTQQRNTIEKLKAATKFSTTQSLIEKYGGGGSAITSGATTPRGPSASNNTERKRGGLQTTPNQPIRPHPDGTQAPVPTTPQQIQAQLVQQQLLAQQRAGIPPQASSPPIQRTPGSSPQQPKHQPQGPFPQQFQRPPPLLNIPTKPALQPEEATTPRWYDRILDLLVGEDETSAKNRYALICGNCRMVNGLAPPGTRSLDEMEGWGCARCGAWNGNERSRVPSRGSESEVKVKREESGGESVEENAEEVLRKSGKKRGGEAEENVMTTRSKLKARREREAEEDEEDEEEESVTEGEEEKAPRKRRGKGRARKWEGDIAEGR